MWTSTYISNYIRLRNGLGCVAASRHVWECAFRQSAVADVLCLQPACNFLIPLERRGWSVQPAFCSCFCTHATNWAQNCPGEQRAARRGSPVCCVSVVWWQRDIKKPHSSFTARLYLNLSHISHLNRSSIIHFTAIPGAQLAWSSWQIWDLCDVVIRPHDFAPFGHD
jgi:hypothetical protein